MKKYLKSFVIALILLSTFSVVAAQQSDFEIKERFRTMYEALKNDIDSAKTREQMAQIPNRIKGLETEFAEHSTLIAGAFYPKTFDGMIGDLRDQFAVSQEKNTTIQAQGERIYELEGQIAGLNARLDTLNAERTVLLAKLRSTTNSLEQQKDLMRKLATNLEEKDKLVSAMVDSIFLPFGKNIDALTATEKNELGRNLAKSNIVTRIADIAQDNVKFLDATKLEAKDYGTLVSQYEQFRNRWNGLRDRVNAAITASEAFAAAKSKGKGTTQASTQTTNPGGQVDVALAEWKQKLDKSFWSTLLNEFTSRGVLVQPFNDGKGFSASIRSYVDSAKSSGMDSKTFVDDVWRGRIDKEWRGALENESMLGKLEYTSLDRAVNDLHKQTFDWKIVFYIVNVLAIVAVGWWFLTRKPKAAPQVTATKAST